MKIDVVNFAKEAVGEIEVPEAVFAYPYKEHLIHTVIRAIRAAQRAGTHKTKVRSEVAGSGRKLWRQKGTGRARVGSIRSPLWRKGGTVHGPQPRSHELGVSVGEKKNALKSALSRKLAEEKILVLDSMELDSHKTAALERAVAGLGAGSRTLLVDSRDNENLMRAARNNPRLKSIDALAVNVYDVVDREHVVFSRPALEKLVEVLQR
ncbi:MAG: 50S ribosomal protein L4 [Acidobacteria bacterium]|nr:MAG: 50S ribosomal protein L4 [Acidobacteriota bacterium]